ncbi:ketoacyl-ACP synthase III [Psychroflexus gondwanensis]|jgi:3-oxoacyl-[acyl-carrier-protein] synthase-3|uniref:3-oxoacyl-ACP synthase III family protein n=1 Tax=Psychroflexus gondwanensis TaxID=251 RepID=UPI0011BEC3DB|nr:beta-ketoacyl-ACP synthase III [Psychroflexus gondwanensis]TXE20937.1 ketoacyl-ACP synthase III [Psychroflexus gondwanensis]
MPNVFISGTGAYVPEKVVPNSFFEKVGSSDEWIYSKLGIKERRIVDGEATSDLAYKAGLEAVKNANLEVKDIDLIIVATTTPDRQAPSCACFVQEKMKAYKAVAFDVAAVCSGALFTISVGYQFVKNNVYNNVLVIGADTFSNIIDWDRRDSVFFGDGAGALVLSKTDEDKGFIDFDLHSDGRGKEHFTVLGGGSETPASKETLEKGMHYFHMNGKEVFDTATKVVPESIQELLQKTNTSIDDVSFMIPHQPSIGILKTIAKKIDMPFEKVMTNMDRYANTSGATIPLVLDEVHKANRFKKDDLLLFAAVGAGWTWGTALYKW